MTRKFLFAAASLAAMSLVFVSTSEAAGGSRSPSPQGSSARSKSPSPTRTTSPKPNLTPKQQALTAAKGATAQMSREVKQLDAKIARTSERLELAQKGEAAQKARGRSGRAATAERANLQNELQDLQVQRTRMQNARNDMNKAIKAASRDNWRAVVAHSRAAQQSLQGVTVPRVTRVTFSALPPSQARAEGAATGARLGSVQRRPLNNGGGSSSGGR
jgi:hypothetical protein